eukprot:4372731-Prymnesium_polylepis.3
MRPACPAGAPENRGSSGLEPLRAIVGPFATAVYSDFRIGRTLVNFALEAVPSDAESSARRRARARCRLGLPFSDDSRCERACLSAPSSRPSAVPGL